MPEEKGKFMGRKKDKTEYEIMDVQNGVPAESREAEKGKTAKQGAEIAFDDAGVVTFKKALNGYKPAEVDEYIALLNANLANARQVFDTQLDEMKSNLAFVTRERDKMKEDFDAMAKKAEEFDAKCEELERTVQETNEIKAKNTQLQEQVNNLYAKLELCKNLAAENRECRNKAAEIDMKRKHMEEEKTKLDEEIARLREENTRQAYIFAEQKKEIEAQFMNENLRRAELMQLHTYHIRKSDELMDEVVKQFKLAKKSLEEIEEKQ